MPICVSATHVAFNSIRMEPVFMMLGQAVATAASLAIDRDTTVQGVGYSDLARQLKADGQILAWPSTTEPAPGANIPVATGANAEPIAAHPPGRFNRYEP